MKSLIAAIAAATGSHTTTKQRGKHSRATQLLALSLLSPICVVAAAETQRFDIPAQPLPDALKVFADQSRMQLLYKPEALSSGTSTSVVGDLDKREALELLLKGTGFEVVFSKGNAATIRPAGFGKSSASASDAGANTLAGGDVSDVETVMVFGTLDNKLSVGSKSGLSLRETPKSITIMTGERIEAQNLTSLQEALIQTTGVAVSAFNPLDTFYYSRGIKLETLQFDGGAPAYTGGLGSFYTPDTATIEQVEVLRGVDGMYSGAGEPGGVINLVRKRPERAAAVRVNLSAGTWDNYRAILDATGPLALDGRLRGRAVASYMDRGYHLDRYTTEKKILYGMLEFDATDSTLLAMGMSYEKRDDSGFPGWGTPRYTDGTPLGLPREFSIAPPWTYWNSETRDVFARVEQKYGDSGVLRLNLNQIEQDIGSKYVTISGGVNPLTLSGARLFLNRADITSTQRMADLSASGKWQLFGRSHSYTVGTDYTELGGKELGYSIVGYPTVFIPMANFFAYNPATFAEPTTVPSSYYPLRERSQRGYYATIGLQLADPLVLTLGGRYGTFRYDHARRTLATGAMSYLRYREREFVPSAALSYKLSDQWTAYVSYGETFNPQGNLLKGPPPGSEQLSPIVGSNIELGIKGDVFDGVIAAASIYRLTRDGQGAFDPAYLGATDPTTGSSCCYLQQGKIIVEGLDLEMSGRVIADWQVFGGYTFTQSEYVGAPTGANNLGRTPKHQVKIWSTYQLPGRFSAITLNAGVTAQTSTYYGSFPGVPGLIDIHYGGLTLWNASAQYALNDKWTLALYSENLTDKVYWQPTGGVGGQNVYGNPRSVTLSLRGRW